MHACTSWNLQNLRLEPIPDIECHMPLSPCFGAPRVCRHKQRGPLEPRLHGRSARLATDQETAGTQTKREANPPGAQPQARNTSPKLRKTSLDNFSTCLSHELDMFGGVFGHHPSMFAIRLFIFFYIVFQNLLLNTSLKTNENTFKR